MDTQRLVAVAFAIVGGVGQPAWSQNSVEKQLKTFESKFQGQGPSAMRSFQRLLVLIKDGSAFGVRRLRDRFFCRMGGQKAPVRPVSAACKRTPRPRMCPDPAYYRKKAEFHQACRRICGLLRRWHPSASVTSSTGTSNVSAAAVLAVGRVLRPAPLTWQDGGGDLANVIACKKLKRAITKAASDRASLDALYLLVAAAQAEKRCSPLKRQASSVSRHVGNWFDGFTSEIHSITAAAVGHSIKKAKLCLISSNEKRRCFAPSARSPQHLSLIGSSKSLRDFNEWSSYVAFLENGLKVFAPLLLHYPGLKKAVAAEITSLKAWEKKRQAACRAVVESTKVLEEPRKFFASGDCTSRTLATAVLTGLRRKYKAAYDAQQARLGAEAERNQRVEAERATALAKLREAKGKSMPCRRARARAEYCADWRYWQQILKQSAHMRRVDRASGTENLAKRRRLATARLRLEDRMTAKEKAIRKLKDRVPKECANPTPLEAARVTACDVSAPAER